MHTLAFYEYIYVFVFIMYLWPLCGHIFYILMLYNNVLVEDIIQCTHLHFMNIFMYFYHELDIGSTVISRTMSTLCTVGYYIFCILDLV